MNSVGGIGGVAIDQDVDISIDALEDRLDHVSLSLPSLKRDDCS